jgi:hypothetical protein
VVGQVLIEGVAQVPAVRQVETRRGDELSLGANPLEEHHQLELEEDDRIDTGPAPVGVEFARPLADKRQVELRLQVAIVVVLGNELLERDSDRRIKVAGLCWAKQGRSRGQRVKDVRRVPTSSVDPRRLRSTSRAYS